MEKFFEKGDERQVKTGQMEFPMTKDPYFNLLLIFYFFTLDVISIHLNGFVIDTI
jgi:hypothetical protein